MGLFIYRIGMKTFDMNFGDCRGDGIDNLLAENNVGMGGKVSFRK